MSNIKFKKTAPWAKNPTRGTGDSAGIDLYISDQFEPKLVILEPGRALVVDTGLAFELPSGTVGLLRPRSSAFKRGLTLNGTIDADYRGNVVLIIRNVSDKNVTLEAGKSYAQMIVVKYENLELIEGELSDTSRGTNGFGSTGNT